MSWNAKAHLGILVPTPSCSLHFTQKTAFRSLFRPWLSPPCAPTVSPRPDPNPETQTGAANGELEDDRSFGSFNHGTELHLAVGAGADAADDEGEEAHDFSVGQRVEAKYVFPGGRLSCSWYPGRIAAVHREGTYHVEYADGDAQDVNSEHIRGVEANAPADGAGDNDDAAVTITVDDGALD